MRSLHLLFAALLALPIIACGQIPVDPDPNGVLLKPIPDKLVVLPFHGVPDMEHPPTHARRETSTAGSLRRNERARFPQKCWHPELLSA